MIRSGKIPGLRKLVQVISGLAQNGHLTGFVTGLIYSGSLKRFCVPGMNCYSCPGALGACPIGAIQSMLVTKKPRFAFYAVGYLAILGMLLGRFICGWLCLFGLIQELLYKIPVRKPEVPAKADRVLRYFKYVFLFVFVILLPVILRDEFGMGLPYFCKWICPVGMLEGGIPLLILNEALRPMAHLLYAWKLALLILLILMSVVIHRPFCKYICPLGAFYALFQRISFLKLRVDRETCVDCGRCAAVCRMQVDPLKAPNSPECIRCGDCVNDCPCGALRFTFKEQER